MKKNSISVYVQSGNLAVSYFISYSRLNIVFTLRRRKTIAYKMQFLKGRFLLLSRCLSRLLLPATVADLCLSGFETPRISATVLHCKRKDP